MSGGIQVVRAESRPEHGRGLIHHVLGLGAGSRPATARANVQGPPVVRLFRNVEGADHALQGALEDRKQRKLRGQVPYHVVEFIFAGPPPYGSPREWTLLEEKRWADAVVRWSRDLLGPRAALSAAALHRDETSPHVHLLAIPISPDGELGWCNHIQDIGDRLGVPPLRPKPAGKASSQAVKVWKRDRSKRSRDVHAAMQDDYQARVGVHFGLGRGERGSKATHKQIDRQRASEAAEKQADERAKQADEYAAGVRADADRKALAIVNAARDEREEAIREEGRAEVRAQWDADRAKWDESRRKFLAGWKRITEEKASAEKAKEQAEQGKATAERERDRHRANFVAEQEQRLANNEYSREMIAKLQAEVNRLAQRCQEHVVCPV